MPRDLGLSPRSHMASLLPGGGLLESTLDSMNIPNPDAQATVSDFVEFTEYLPADILRSMHLLRSMDRAYDQLVESLDTTLRTVSDTATPHLPGQHPSHTPDQRHTPDPKHLQNQPQSSQSHSSQSQSQSQSHVPHNPSRRQPSLPARVSHTLQQAYATRINAYQESIRIEHTINQHYAKVKDLHAKLQLLHHQFDQSSEPKTPAASPRVTRQHRQHPHQHTPHQAQVHSPDKTGNSVDVKRNDSTRDHTNKNDVKTVAPKPTVRKRRAPKVIVPGEVLAPYELDHELSSDSPSDSDDPSAPPSASLTTPTSTLATRKRAPAPFTAPIPFSGPSTTAPVSSSTLSPVAVTPHIHILPKRKQPDSPQKGDNPLASSSASASTSGNVVRKLKIVNARSKTDISSPKASPVSPKTSILSPKTSPRKRGQPTRISSLPEQTQDPENQDQDQDPDQDQDQDSEDPGVAFPMESHKMDADADADAPGFVPRLALTTSFADPPGSASAPWLQLTPVEMQRLRRRMKKNSAWTPSDTLVFRELRQLGRGPGAFVTAQQAAAQRGQELAHDVMTIHDAQASIVIPLAAKDGEKATSPRKLLKRLLHDQASGGGGADRKGLEGRDLASSARLDSPTAAPHDGLQDELMQDELMQDAEAAADARILTSTNTQTSDFQPTASQPRTSPNTADTVDAKRTRANGKRKRISTEIDPVTLSASAAAAAALPSLAPSTAAPPPSSSSSAAAAAATTTSTPTRIIIKRAKTHVSAPDSYVEGGHSKHPLPIRQEGPSTGLADPAHHTAASRSPLPTDTEIKSEVEGQRKGTRSTRSSTVSHLRPRAQPREQVSPETAQPHVQPRLQPHAQVQAQGQAQGQGRAAAEMDQKSTFRRETRLEARRNTISVPLSLEGEQLPPDLSQAQAEEVPSRVSTRSTPSDAAVKPRIPKARQATGGPPPNVPAISTQTATTTSEPATTTTTTSTAGPVWTAAAERPRRALRPSTSPIEGRQVVSTDAPEGGSASARPPTANPVPGRRSRRPAPGVVHAGSGGDSRAVSKRKAAPKRRLTKRAKHLQRLHGRADPTSHGAGPPSAADADGDADDGGGSEDELVEIDDEGNPIDPAEPRYCLCNRVSFGTMIQCDAADTCAAEWFHLECVGLTATPSSRQKWFCPECRPRKRQA